MFDLLRRYWDLPAFPADVSTLSPRLTGKDAERFLRDMESTPITEERRNGSVRLLPAELESQTVSGH